MTSPTRQQQTDAETAHGDGDHQDLKMLKVHKLTYSRTVCRAADSSGLVAIRRIDTTKIS
jgi:hypothetical protein